MRNTYVLTGRFLISKGTLKKNIKWETILNAITKYFYFRKISVSNPNFNAHLLRDGYLKKGRRG